MVDSDFVRCGTSNSSRRKMLKSSHSDSDIDSLPDDAVNEILVRIPAQDILKASMFVCRKWYRMIRMHNFVFDHLHHSTPGFLIRNLHNSRVNFMSITRSGEIQISKVDYAFKNRVWSSCNGLVLELESINDEHELIITNPLTNQHLALPPFFVRSISLNYKSTMAYVASRMAYKVARMYYLGPESREHCAILTVGVDNAWRRVDTQHLSLAASRLLSRCCPLVTEGGFVHWADDWHHKYVFLTTKIITQMSNQFVLTLNMETEIITRISAPQCNGGYYYYKYLSGGSCLSLLIGRGYLKWEVWEMKPETLEWTKLPDIDLEAHKALLNESYDVKEAELKHGDGNYLDCKLLPAGWLKYRDVIVFVTYRPIGRGSFTQARLRVVYNVQTQKISLFALHYHCYHYIDHRNSLIRKVCH